ncbi:hypothetical protein So717_20060 [Roseobacter cerasinus]|uniref:Lipoprotein n=1 Tax=Roseobacter cerasinus TaxID=2602289 RepID=A0A640VPS9_9RHOB|nr:hypothetical protein [Roseobacter cerasinus]GFE50253.1 hypothetical protein So717_20060 [Roseobacter cerasinus]
MFKQFMASSLLLAVLAACASGPTLTPEEKARRDARKALHLAALDAAREVQVGGKTFRVAKVETGDRDDTYAFVDLISTPRVLYVPELEQAARLATGCDAEFAAGVLAFIRGDLNTVDIGKMTAFEVAGRRMGHRVDLSC